MLRDLVNDIICFVCGVIMLGLCMYTLISGGGTPKGDTLVSFWGSLILANIFLMQVGGRSNDA